MPKLWKFSFSKKETVFFAIILLFSFFLMTKTFKVSTGGDLMFASKVWSDFAATIPLIRSFSKGFNFPPQYPIYAGPPIRYHFVFYLLVGMLEKIGLPLNWALNLPSMISFFLLLVTIYYFAKYVFKDKSVGYLSVIFFLFNGSFSFLEFFKKHPFGLSSINTLIKNTEFPSFGPYDGKIVSAFWNLNIYTNQRHLALAYFLLLLILFQIYKGNQNPKKFTYKKVFIMGVVVGFFPFLHLAVFGMLGIILITSFFIFSKIRKRVFLIGTLALLLAIPQMIYMGSSNLELELINPGYLVDNLTAVNFIGYWFLNLGFVSLLAAVGLIYSDKNQVKLFLVLFMLFLVGNVFQFSSEIAANHKFFNLFVIGINMFASYLLVKLWRKKTIQKLFVVICFVLMTFSGVIDIFPIFNDKYVTIPDTDKNKVANFIENNTSVNSVFLNGSFLYDPASLAGRGIYMGWPYFAWSAGYDTNYRYTVMKNIFSSDSKTSICNILKDEKLDYIEIKNPTDLEGVEINYQFFDDNFKQVFFDNKTNIKIFEVESSCLDSV